MLFTCRFSLGLLTNPLFVFLASLFHLFCHIFGLAFQIIQLKAFPNDPLFQVRFLGLGLCQLVGQLLHIYCLNLSLALFNQQLQLMLFYFQLRDRFFQATSICLLIALLALTFRLLKSQVCQLLLQVLYLLLQNIFVRLHGFNIAVQVFFLKLNFYQLLGKGFLLFLERLGRIRCQF